MKMPGGHAAIVDRQKLTGYCLNAEHPRGKHKARVFAVLGFTTENAESCESRSWRPPLLPMRGRPRQTGFGDRYVIEFEIRFPRGSGIVRSMWIVRRGESAPRLTSCFVK
jgi:hypothetical protein